MRDYLFPSEIEKLLKQAKKTSRHNIRNQLIILIGYRHGLRASEIADLKFSDIELEEAKLNCRRLKGSHHNIHPLMGDEIRLIKRWLKIHPTPNGEYIFPSERKTRITRQSIWRIIKTLGKDAKLSVPMTTHMLKHSCGYYLADKGYDTRLIQDYLGHKNIQNTVRYTSTNANRFKGLWR